MGLLITSPHDSALLWLEDQGVSEAFTAQSQMRTARHPAQTCTWPNNCVHSLLQATISFGEPITPLCLSLSEEALPTRRLVCLRTQSWRAFACQVVGGPQADGSATPLGRGQLFMSLFVTHRELAVAHGQSPGEPGQKDDRKSIPHLSQLKTGLAVGAHTGLSFQEASHRICGTVSLRRLSWHVRMYYLMALPKSLVFHPAYVDLVITERLESTKSRQSQPCPVICHSVPWMAWISPCVP